MAPYIFPPFVPTPADYSLTISDEGQPWEGMEKEIKELRRAISMEREAELAYPDTLAALWAGAPAKLQRAETLYHEDVNTATSSAVNYKLESDLDMALNTGLNHFKSPSFLVAQSVIKDGTFSTDSNDIGALSHSPSTVKKDEWPLTASTLSVAGTVPCRLPTANGICGVLLSNPSQVRRHILSQNSPHLLSLRSSTFDRRTYKARCAWPGCDSYVKARSLQGHVIGHMVCFVCPFMDCKNDKLERIYDYRDSLRSHLDDFHHVPKPIGDVDRFGVLRMHDGL